MDSIIYRASSAMKSELELRWESKWPEMCNAKALLKDLYIRSDMKVSESAFRTKIVESMRDSKSEDWMLVKAYLMGCSRSSVSGER